MVWHCVASDRIYSLILCDVLTDAFVDVVVVVIGRSMGVVGWAREFKPFPAQLGQGYPFLSLL